MSEETCPGRLDNPGLRVQSFGMPVALVFALMSAGAPRPPEARMDEVVVATLLGEERRDEYAWLRAGGEDPAVRVYLAAENAHAEAWMRPRRRLVAALEREIEAMAYVADETPPVRRGAWLYWARRGARQDYPVILRRPAAGGPPQVVLDLPAMARGKPYFALDVLELSDDGRSLAYSVDEVGDEDYTLRIKDLEAGRHGPEVLAHVSSAAWSAGGDALLYTVRDDTLRSYALRSRTRGPGGEDRLIFEEADPRFDLSIERSRSGEWLLLTSDAYVASEVQVARADAATGPWTAILRREAGHLYDVDHAGDTFYVRSNRGAPQFRVFAAPEADPRPWRWTALVPERPEVAITGIDAFAGHLVVHQRERGSPRVALVDLATGRRDDRPGAVSTREIAAIVPDENPEPGATHYRVRVESVHAPARTVEIALDGGAEAVIHRREVPRACGGAARVAGVARAGDGVEIPYLRFAGAGGGEGPRPILLEAYGSYGSVFDPDFEAGRCALMNRGVDFVIAWVRGGGELGEPWHEAGRRRRRMTAIGDLIAVADHLVASGATTPATLAVAGDSAGGGLVAATIGRRPELFAAAVLRVPFLDVVGTMADPAAPLTTVEYDEWGDPRVRGDLEVMRQWCPYSNLTAQTYPAILVESSLADARVAYHEQARYVARLRRVGRGGPFLLRTELHASHAGASGRGDRVRARAYEVAFLLSRLGLAE